MNLMLDTNVIIDYIARRQPWYQDVEQIWERLRTGADRGYVSASALTDIYFITKRILNDAVALKAVTLCDNSLTICVVDRSTIRRALALRGSDFEDNVVIACAERENLDAIITRNRHDFQYSSVPAYTPADYLHLQQVAEAESE